MSSSMFKSNATRKVLKRYFSYIWLGPRKYEFGVFIYRIYEKFYIIQQECSMYGY